MKNRLKIILTGLEYAGKTSILIALERKYNFESEILNLKPTIKIGSYLSERAEQKKEKIELEKAMLVSDNEDDAEKIDDSAILEIQKAMITPLNLHKIKPEIRQVITRKN